MPNSIYTLRKKSVSVIRSILFVNFIVTRLYHSVCAQTTNVTALDPRISYVGDWVEQNSGGHKFTVSQGSSFSFTFQGMLSYTHVCNLLMTVVLGSTISWYSVKEPNGGVASVSVDMGNQQLVDASAGTSLGDDPIEMILFSQTDLDPSKEHTITVSYSGTGALGGPYVDIYLLS